MKSIFCRTSLALLLLVIPVALISAKPEGKAGPAPEIDAALKPFVESHSLAGAVTLVADKDRVISVNAVGFLDIGAKMQHGGRCHLLDRLDVQADHRRRPDDARGRGQGQPR